MFDYNQIVQNRQRHEEITRRANAPEPEGWTHPVPNIFDKLFAALKPTKRADQQANRRSATTKQTLATK